MNTFAANGDTPLHVAMRLSDENQCLIITKLLVEAGCSACELDADDKPPIQAAVARGFVSVVEYLLSQDMPLPSRILFAALQATVVKRVEMIRLLVNRGANVHVLNPDGDTLLHITTRSLDRSVCLQIAVILIDVGCNPSALNLRGETPLHIAAKQGYHEIVNYLILFSPSSGISTLLQYDPALQLPTLRSLIGNTDGLRFSPEEEVGVIQVIRQFLDNQDKCLEWAMIFIGAAGDLFARSPGNAVLFDIALRRGFSKVTEFLTYQDLPLPPAALNLFAVLRRQASILSFLVYRGADVGALDEDGNTLLHVAMSELKETQCLTTTKILVEAGCNPFTPNFTNKQPIHIAVSRGFSSVVEYLLSHALNTEASLRKGADVHPLDKDGGTLLHVAMSIHEETKCLTITKILVEAGCNPFTPNIANKQPIHIAVSRGFPSVVKYLLSPTFNTDASLRKGADVHALDQDGNTLLHVAMSIHEEIRCLTTTKILVEAGCNPFTPNITNKQPIHIAVSRGLSYVVKYLLSHTLNAEASLRRGADVHALDQDGDTLLHVAMSIHEETRCLTTTKVLVEAGSDPFTPNIANKQPIHIAVSRGFPSVVKYLLSHTLNAEASLRRGADVHALDKDGDTLLHVAMSILSETQCLTTTQILVEVGRYDPSTPNIVNKQPIHLAVSRGFLSVAKYLLSRIFNADVSLPPDLLFTALRCRQKYSMIQLLVDHRADVSHRAPNGDHLLHTLFRSPIIEVTCLRTTKLLCEAGCNCFAPDANGNTPLHLAINQVFTTIVDYLLSRKVPLPSDILFFALDSQPSKNIDQWVWMISSLVREGANIQTLDQNRNTLLHRVLSMSSAHNWRHCLKVIEIFTEAGCNASTRNVDGKLPIQIAVTHVMPTIVDYLLSRNATFPPNILLDVWEGEDATSSGVLKMVTSFLQHGADVCAIAANGDTVLHVALAWKWWQYGNSKRLLAIVDVLVRAGCNTDARDAMGRTPLELAAARGYSDVVECLQRSSAAL